MTAPDLRSPADCAVDLVRRRGRRAGGVFVDVGFGDGAIRAALASSGIGYVGATTDRKFAKQLAGDGVEVVIGDVSKPDELFAEIAANLSGRQVAAVFVGDLPSRVVQVTGILGAAHRFCTHADRAPLVVHVPNVTHLDVGTKLLMGRFDVAPGRVLSSEHVRFFSEHGLTSLLRAHGFSQVDAEDLERDASDQHFPEHAVPLERTTLVGTGLRALRAMSGHGAFVEHFVRLYEPAAPLPVDVSEPTDATRTDAPFLSVLVRTQGRRWETLQESLLCLAAQTCDDFEVLVLVHDGPEGTASELEAMVAEFHPTFARRVRIVEVHGGGRSRPLNEGARAAQGRYLAMLDDDDLVFSHWVEAFRSGAERAPGHVVRVPVATQEVAERPGVWDGGQGYEVIGRPRLLYALEFDHVDHLADNRTPNNGYAVPRSLVVDLGQSWDESLPVLEDWDHLLRAASICGVESVPTVTALVRSWSVGENSKSAHSSEIWEVTRRRIVERHDALPLVLDVGSFSKVRELSARLDVTTAVLGETHHRLHALQHSRSWKLTKPVRAATRLARKVRDGLRRMRHSRTRGDLGASRDRPVPQDRSSEEAR